MADRPIPTAGLMLGLGALAGAAATVALLATRLRVFHHADCPACGTPLVVSYEPSDAEPRVRREEEVAHPPRLGQIVRRARGHPRRPSRTVVVIGYGRECP